MLDKNQKNKQKKTKKKTKKKPHEGLFWQARLNVHLVFQIVYRIAKVCFISHISV